MLGEFRYEVRETLPDTAIVALFGVINERSDLVSIPDKIPENVIIDLGGVQNINSVGVREWMRFIGKVCAEHSVTLQNCVPVMVRQFNMIFNARGAARIKSVILPYYCAQCSNEPYITLEIVEGKNEFPLTLECAQCKGTAEFDDLPETYLAFLAQPTQPKN